MPATEYWAEAAGGGAVAAVELGSLSSRPTSFFTSVGDDELGHRAVERLRARGLDVHVAFRPAPTRRAVTYVDSEGERTITVIGARLQPEASDDLPWELLDAVDAVYFTAGGEGALHEARRARVLVATTRVYPLLLSARVVLDAVVGSAADPSEVHDLGLLDPQPRAIVMTDGADGGTFTTPDGQGRFDAVPLGGPVADKYGAGDCFAAGLTLALGGGANLPAAARYAARRGAAALGRRGPYA